MPRRIRVSFLGVLNYTRLNYSLDNHVRNTPFVAAVLASLLDIDDIHILATRDAQLR